MKSLLRIDLDLMGETFREVRDSVVVGELQFTAEHAVDDLQDWQRLIRGEPPERFAEDGLDLSLFRFGLLLLRFGQPLVGQSCFGPQFLDVGHDRSYLRELRRRLDLLMHGPQLGEHFPQVVPVLPDGCAHA